MDSEHQPLHIFVKTALLRTAQGRVVILSFIVYWLLSLGVILLPDIFISSQAIMLGTLIIFLSWPFVVLLITLLLSSLHYRPNRVWASVVMFFSVMPLWWVYL